MTVRLVSMLLMTVLCVAFFGGAGWVLGQFAPEGLAGFGEPFSPIRNTTATHYAVVGALGGAVVGPILGARVKQKK